jgi:hypothetical protein
MWGRVDSGTQLSVGAGESSGVRIAVGFGRILENKENEFLKNVLML